MKKYWQILAAILIFSFPAWASYVIPNQAITQYKLAPRPQSSASPTPVGSIGVSPSTGNFSTISGSVVAVTNAILTITTTGRPVFVTLIPDGNTSNPANIQVEAVTSVGNVGLQMGFFLFRDGSQINYSQMGVGTYNSGSNVIFSELPPSAFSYVDFPTAGAHTYQLKVQSSAGIVQYCALAAFEM